MSKKQNYTVDSVPDLTGKTVLITGGAAGIGLECTYLLLRRNATVYVASRSEPRALSSLETIQKRLDREGCEARGRVIFHHLDLSTIAGSARSAREFVERVDREAGGPGKGRLDVLIANAGVNLTVFAGEYVSDDGYEPMFQTNHLGHVSFILTLLPILRRTARLTRDVRIVTVGSIAMYFGHIPVYSSLRTPSPSDAKPGIFWPITYGYPRYGRSKVALWYFTRELSRRLREGAVGVIPGNEFGTGFEEEEKEEGVYVNSCHPGTVGWTGMGRQAGGTVVPEWLISAIRTVVSFFGETVLEAAMTQTYLATSPDVKEGDVTGRFYQPVQDWLFRYVRSRDTGVSWFAGDEKAARECWEWSVGAMGDALEKEKEEGKIEEGEQAEEGWETVKKGEARSEGEGVRRRL